MRDPNDAQRSMLSKVSVGLCGIGLILGALWFNQDVRLSSQQVESNADKEGVTCETVSVPMRDGTML